MAKQVEFAPEVCRFLEGKSPFSISLFTHFVQEYEKLGTFELIPAKTMIGIYNGKRRVAYINQFGKQFLHVFFMFDKPYEENLCFQKIANVPGTDQFNHHLRILSKEDINEEVKFFMKLAIENA